jgi:PAS domain-containing protein
MKKLLNLQDSIHVNQVSILFPQHVMAVIQQLQLPTDSLDRSSFSIYDRVEQRILSTSTSVAVLLGYSADALDHMGELGLATLIHPDDVDRVAEHYQRLTTLRLGEMLTLKYRMKREEGLWCWLRSREVLLEPENQKFPSQILGVLQVLED